MKITLVIDDIFAPVIHGELSANAALEAVSLDPTFWFNAADEVTVQGGFGQATEVR
jgi:hypothetical protein